MVGKKSIWSLNIDWADNGGLAVLKCLKCRKVFAHVFLTHKDVWNDIDAWKNPIVDKHNLEHLKKV